MAAAGPGPDFAVVSNPASRRNRRGLADVAAVLEAWPGVAHHVLERFDDLPGVVASLRRRGTDCIVVNGGDGTVQAVLGALLGAPAPGGLPLLAVLPGGTSNTICGDVGLEGRRGPALARLLAGAAARGIDAARLVERAVLRVDYRRDRAPLHGMLFGAAGITRGIQCHRRLMPWPWLPDPVATLIMLALLAGSALTGGRIAREVLAGEPIGIEVDGEPLGAEHHAVLLASTLERIVLGSRPFWGEGPGAVRLTRVLYPPRRLLRSLPRLLFGRDRRALPACYRSCNASRVAMAITSAFTLDGEFYEPDAAQPVVLSADRRIGFLRG